MMFDNGDVDRTGQRSVSSRERSRLWEVATIALVPIAAAAAMRFTDSQSIVMLVLMASSLLAAGSIWSLIRRRSERQDRDLRQAEQRLRRLQSRWDSLQRDALQSATALSKLRDGVVLISASKTILLINRAARQLLNLEAEQDYTNRLLNEVVRLPDLNQATAAANDSGEPQSVLIEVKSDDGVYPIQFQIDQISGTPGSGLLITLHNESEARRVDEMRREFVANISHELKTPLAAIKGYAETVELAIQDDPTTAKRFLGQIHSQCLRLERLIADMMQLARAQAGPDNLSFGKVSMSDVIAESLHSYRPIAEAKQVELRLSPVADAFVHTDREATLTITNNLIGNAIHYTPSGGRVTVSCRGNGTCWALVVADTGVGIPADEQQRIFERFYRVEKNRDSTAGGTGIGLSMVKNLAGTMGGEVRVESEPGQGSTFEVLLPRA